MSRFGPFARTWIAAFLVLTALATTWVLSTPVLANPDEPAHAVKATALMRGEILPPKLELPDEGPGSLIRGSFTTRVTVPNAYARIGEEPPHLGEQSLRIPGCYIFDSRVPAGSAPAWLDDTTPVESTTINGRYPPTYYALVGWVTRLDTSVKSFFAMRMASLVVNVALLATAFAMAREARRFRFLALGLVVACTPQVISLAGAVNPNGLEIAAGICAWVALGVALLYEGDRIPARVLVAATVACVLLAGTRPLSTVWLALIALTMLVAFGDRRRVVARLGETGVRISIAVVGVATLAGAAWTVFSDDLGNNSGYDPRGLNRFDAARHSLALTWSYLQQMVSVFGWIHRIPAPFWLTWAWGFIVVVLVITALRSADRRAVRTMLGLIALVLLAPTIIQTPVATEIGFPWSGRYGLAMAAGVPLIAAFLLGERRLDATTTRRLSLGIVSVAAAGQVVAHAAAMRRWVVGTDGPLNYLTGDGWKPPLPPWLLLAATVASAIAWAVLAHRIATGGGAEDEPDALPSDRLVHIPA